MLRFVCWRGCATGSSSSRNGSITALPRVSGCLASTSHNHSSPVSTTSLVSHWARLFVLLSFFVQNKCECTIDQELVDADAYAPGRRYVCTVAHTRRKHFSAWNDVMATVLKLRRRVRNPTPSIDAYFLEEQKLPNFIPLRFETTEPYHFFEKRRRRPRTTTATRWELFLIQKLALRINEVNMNI